MPAYAQGYGGQTLLSLKKMAVPNVASNLLGYAIQKSKVWKERDFRLRTYGVINFSSLSRKLRHSQF